MFICAPLGAAWSDKLILNTLYCLKPYYLGHERGPIIIIIIIRFLCLCFILVLVWDLEESHNFHSPKTRFQTKTRVRAEY